MTILKDQAGNAFSTTNQLPTKNYATARTVNPTAGGNGAYMDMMLTSIGALVSKPYSIPEMDFQFAVAAPITGTTDTVIKAAGAAGVKNYMTALQVINTSATATEYVVKDGATVIYRGFAPANMTAVDDTVFPTPLKGSAAVALNFACITTAANVYVNAQGYQAP